MREGETGGDGEKGEGYVGYVFLALKSWLRNSSVKCTYEIFGNCEEVEIFFSEQEVFREMTRIISMFVNVPKWFWDSIFCYFMCLWAELGKVTLKSNGDEALSDKFLLKSNDDEALNDVFP